MKSFVLGVVITIAAALVFIGGVIYTGRIDVAADSPHSDAVFRLIETARDNAIERQAKKLSAPGDLADPERIRRGAGNYAAMCVECHLAPGRTSSEIRMGLYPEPPDLTRTAEGESAARSFWVIKHGVKASSMPAWSKGGIEDEAIWDLVAFVQKLPTLDAAGYEALVAASDGHSHGGMTGDTHEHERADAAHAHDAAPTSKRSPKPHDPHDGHPH